MDRKLLRKKAVALREEGRTYTEIKQLLGMHIPKGTLSYWFQNVTISPAGKKRRQRLIDAQLVKSRKLAVEANKRNREAYLCSLRDNNKHLSARVHDRDVAKIILATLYMAEGTKRGGTGQGAITFSNSDPCIIRTFLYLMWYCYPLDIRKFRCVIQCRADSNQNTMEQFWARITKIPKEQFYATRVDPRTIGKPSKKKDYKGVCRIEYFSADLFHELMAIFEIIHDGACNLDEER